MELTQVTPAYVQVRITLPELEIMLKAWRANLYDDPVLFNIIGFLDAVKLLPIFLGEGDTALATAVREFAAYYHWPLGGDSHSLTL